MKKVKYIGILILSVFMCTGCGLTVEREVVERDTETLQLNIEQMHEDGVTSVNEEISIDGEPFSIICTYDTGNYDLSQWRVTDNKFIQMSVKTKNLPEGYTVHIEHVHADMVLQSTTPMIDGITQDSMDDSDHRVPTQGFYIDDTYSYNNSFLVEGYTDQFYTLWGYAFGTYGNISSSYERLTEKNIREVGTYAEKLSVVYDIIIQTPECPEGYVRSVESEVQIPLTGEIQTVTKDFWTGEIIDE